jgi:hypothetical protein
MVDMSDKPLDEQMEQWTRDKLSEEMTHRQKLGAILKGVGIVVGAGVGIHVLASDSDAGEIKHKYRRGKYVGTEVTHGKPEPLDSYKGIRGRNFNDLMDEGIEAYENNAYKRAELIFSYIGNHGRPGSVDGNIWHVKTYSKLKGKQKAATLAGTYLSRKPGNKYLTAMKERLQRDGNVDRFSRDAWDLYLDGKEAFERNNHQTAISKLYDTVKEDPHHIFAWVGIAHLKSVSNNGNDKERFQSELEVFCLAREKNPDSRILKDAIFTRESYLKK